MKVKKQKATGTKRAEIFCICVLAYMLIHWVIFYVGQNVNSILLAFQKFDPEVEQQVFLKGSHLFDNFKKFFQDLFKDPAIGRYFLTGALYHLITLIALPLSWMVSFLIYKKLPLSGLFKIVMFLPSILSSMVIAMIFKYASLDGFRGVWMTILKLPYNEFPSLLYNEKYALATMICYQFFFAVNGSLLINIGTMSRTPVDLIEYGKLEGLTLFQEFFIVTLPLMFPMLQVMCLGIFVGFFNAVGPLYALYGDGHAAGVYMPENVKTFGYYMLTSVISSNVNELGDPRHMYGYTTAANLSIGLISIPIVWGTKKLLDRFDPEAEF